MRIRGKPTHSLSLKQRARPLNEEELNHWNEYLYSLERKRYCRANNIILLPMPQRYRRSVCG